MGFTTGHKVPLTGDGPQPRVPLRSIVKWWVNRWLFDWTKAPQRSLGRGYGWLYLGSGGGYRSHWKLLWWIAVPVWLQSRFVHWANVRHCKEHGHDDFLWHLHEAPPVELPSGVTLSFTDQAPVCGDCMVMLTGCTGTHRDGRPQPALPA